MRHLFPPIITVLSWIFFAPSLSCVKMGVMKDCDDGNYEWKKDIETEGGLHYNTHCSHREKMEFNEATLAYPLKRCELNSTKLKPGEHRCMEKAIAYKKNVIPVAGTHRPVWPVYGEYKFVPPQRWIHNLEHGGLVFLYHPCADQKLVEEMRRLVTGCLRRHVITPSRRLRPQRPFALVTWGCYLNFGKFEEAGIVDWIRNNAIRKEGLQAAPEFKVWKDGDYDHLLKEKAKSVTDEQDSDICPQSDFSSTFETLIRKWWKREWRTRERRTRV